MGQGNVERWTAAADFLAIDGARLNGMALRRHSIELGPSVEWAAPWVSLSLAWSGDVSGATRGTALRAGAYRQVIAR